MNNQTILSSKTSNITQIIVSPTNKKRNLQFTPNEISYKYINEYDTQEIIPLDSGRSKSVIHSKTLSPKKNNNKLLNLPIHNISKNHSLKYNINDIKKKESLLTEENFNSIISSINELFCHLKKERQKTEINKNYKKYFKQLFLPDDRKKKKTYSLNINNLSDISNKISKKKISNLKINEDEVRQFTNIEDITNFYSYTEQSFKMMFEIEKIKEINKCKPCDFPFDEEVNKGNKKLAIFDLDETLIHCQTKNINECQHKINIITPSKKILQIGINIRPNLEKALNIIKDKYIIVIFTASHKSYADSILNYIDPNNKYFKYRLYRNNCTTVKYEGKEIYIKDLSVFKNIDLKNIIIVDNSVVSFAYQLNNGMPILPYYDYNKDNELVCLAYYLIAIFDYNDLREANKLHVKLDYYKDAAIKKLNNENEDNDNYESVNDVSFKNNNICVEYLKTDSNIHNDYKNDVINYDEEITYRKNYDFINFSQDFPASIISKFIHHKKTD